MVNSLFIQYYLCQKTIINIMLQSSTYKKHPAFNRSWKQKTQADTSQTLTYLSPNISNIQMNIYKEVQNQNNNYQILEYTLSHCNLDWLQDRLGQVHRMGNDRFNSGDGVEHRRQSMDNLELLSDQVTTTLRKISQHRKVIQQKLREYLYLKSKETDKKNIRKSNIYKYKQLLVAIKKLHDQTTNNTTNQFEINEMKDRLKGSGVVLVPSLIQKSLYNLAQKTINHKKILLEISNIGNLRTIVDYFMSKSLISGEYQVQNQHKLYIKFKQYVLLKSYVRFNQQGLDGSHRQLDRLCQANISACIEDYMSKLSSLQLTKIRSLVQCNQLINFYLSEKSKKFVLELMRASIFFIQNLKRKSNKIEEEFIACIINKNKKVDQYKNFCIPSNCFSIMAENYQQMKGTTGIQQIGQFLKFIDDRSMFLELYARQFSINFTIQDIKILILRECLRHILNPLIKLSKRIIKITHKNNKERHYHSTKLVARNIQTWKQLFSLQKLKKQQQLIHQIQCKIDELQIREQKNEKIKVKDVKNIKKMKNKKQKENNMTVAQFYIEYHTKFGQVYLYLANKISNIGNTPKNEVKLTEQLINVWTQLICSQIMHHQLEQLQPAHILADLNFMQGEMIEIIEQSHRKQNKLDNLYTKLQKQKKSTKQKQIKNINEQQKQNIYLQVMELNLKVISYSKLMSVCKIIGIQNQILKINEEIYEDTYMELQF